MVSVFVQELKSRGVLLLTISRSSVKNSARKSLDEVDGLAAAQQVEGGPSLLHSASQLVAFLAFSGTSSTEVVIQFSSGRVEVNRRFELLIAKPHMVLPACGEP
jgi:hypothetical protein